MHHLPLLAFFVTVFMSVSAAWAQTPSKELDSHGDWKTYTMDGGKVCYALSVPKDITPKNVNRDPIFFLVTDWQAKQVKAEPEVIPGYKYKDGSSVTVQVGPDKFTFVTNNDAPGSGAWSRDRADEARLMTLMQRGSTMTVTGTSSRGTVTKDTYSLTGFSAALASIHKACKM